MTATLTEIKKQANEYVKALPEKPAIPPFKPAHLAQRLDQTLHKPETTPRQVDELCDGAMQYGFAAVYVSPLYLPQIVQRLKGSKVKACTVAGFPLGAYPTRMKVAEARLYASQGAQEIDMVIPVGLLKSGHYAQVYRDIHGVAAACHERKVTCKVILEMGLLERFEKVIGCLLCMAAGADYVKTSTGINAGGATLDDVDLMRRVVGSSDKMKVKAAGGIRTLADALAMIQAGADRLGTSSGIKIMQELKAT